MKWWGWGDPNIRFNLDERVGFKNFLKTRVGWVPGVPDFIPDEKKFPLRPSNIPKDSFLQLTSLLNSPEQISADPFLRLQHSFGKSYLDLIKIRNGEIPEVTDAVVFPQTEIELLEIVKFCSRESISLIPFGGGSSVVGGVAPRSYQNRPVLTVNLARLSRLKDIDLISRLATFESGVFGPNLEEQLSAYKFRLGHYPQSFEFSTLGGWIASRSSGQNSAYFGGIERLVSSLRVVTPEGILDIHLPPRHAVGPDFKELFLGSEGTLGIISEATMKISPLPQTRDYSLVLTKSFTQSAEVARKIVQAGLRPALLRASDGAETEVLFAMSERTGHALKNRLQRSLQSFFQWRGWRSGQASALMIGLEGENNQVRSLKRQIFKLISGEQILNLGRGPGKKWLKDRFFLPYLRDELLDQKILIETFETATTWNQYDSLYEHIRAAVRRSLPEPHVVFAHLSHVYSDGASLYFTVIARQRPGHEVEQWNAVKKDLNDTIVKSGGVISHHHGIGLDHRNHTPWTAIDRQLLKSIKQTVDPKFILNPGKLF